MMKDFKKASSLILTTKKSGNAAKLAKAKKKSEKFVSKDDT